MHVPGLASESNCETNGRVTKRKRTVKAENVHLRVSKQQKEAISAAAERKGMTVSTWILVVVLEKLEKLEKDEGGE